MQGLVRCLFCEYVTTALAAVARLRLETWCPARRRACQSRCRGSVELLASCPIRSRADRAGVPSLAPRPDAVFGQAVLDVGGKLAAVVPSRDYRQTQVSAGHAPLFDELLSTPLGRHKHSGGQSLLKRVDDLELPHIQEAIGAQE